MAQRQPAAGVMDLFADSADKLVSLLSAKSDVIFDEAAASLERDGAPPSSRSLKYVLNTLMQTYQFRDRVLALRVQGPTTEALICRLLVRLLDDRVNSLQEGQQLLKALNVLMLKILEHSNRTHVFCALLTLLRVAPEPIVVQGQAVQQRFSDLVVKCLIKLTKALQSFIGELDVGALLLAIHHFLAGLGAEEIRRRGSEDDKPLRMVKTVLHEVCKVEGYKVVPHLSAVLQREQGDSTIIYNYVDLNLQTLEAAGVIKPSSVPTTPKQSPAVGSPSPAISLSKEQQATPATAAADRCQATPQQTPPSITSTSTPAYSPTGTPVWIKPASAALPAPDPRLPVSCFHVPCPCRPLHSLPTPNSPPLPDFSILALVSGLPLVPSSAIAAYV